MLSASYLLLLIEESESLSFINIILLLLPPPLPLKRTTMELQRVATFVEEALEAANNNSSEAYEASKEFDDDDRVKRTGLSLSLKFLLVYSV